MVLEGDLSQQSTVVELAYSGALPPEMADGVNVVGPEVVELSVYSTWFPVPSDLSSFDWHMSVALPTGWAIVTNGRSGGLAGEWWSVPNAPIGDIVVVASPRMLRHTVAPGCELVCAGVTCGGEQARTAMMGKALELLGQWYGLLDSESDHTVVVTDRRGFAYSRMPIIFLSSQAGPTLAHDQQTLFHELSHFWWNLAPVGSYDDWLNESLAEYSSVRLVGALLGRGAAERALERRLTCASTSRDDPPMCATPLSSEESGYANKYARGALFHEACALRLGRDTYDAVLRDLRVGHVHGPQLVIQDLLDAVSVVDAGFAVEAAHVLSVPSWDGTWPEDRVLPGVE